MANDTYTSLTVERDGGFAVVTLNRPQRMNALSRALIAEIGAAFTALGAERDVRVIILTGSGDKAFCAGADLKERKTMPPARVPDFVRNIRRTMDDVEALPQPTIAVVNGFAFGGGTELLLACDLRVAAAHAQFGLTETTLAIIPGAGGTQRLPRLVGRSRAKDLILTGRKLDAVEAERIGLVNRIAPAGKLAETAVELARTIAANGPVAVRAAKAAIDSGCEEPLTKGLEIEARCYERVLPTQDRLEALAAFAEKRKPSYQGR